MNKVWVVERLNKGESLQLCGLYRDWNAIRKDFPSTNFEEIFTEFGSYYLAGNSQSGFVINHWQVHE